MSCGASGLLRNCEASWAVLRDYRHDRGFLERTVRCDVRRRDNLPDMVMFEIGSMDVNILARKTGNVVFDFSLFAARASPPRMQTRYGIIRAIHAVVALKVMPQVIPAGCGGNRLDTKPEYSSSSRQHESFRRLQSFRPAGHLRSQRGYHMPICRPRPLTTYLQHVLLSLYL